MFYQPPRSLQCFSLGAISVTFLKHHPPDHHLHHGSPSLAQIVVEALNKKKQNPSTLMSSATKQLFNLLSLFASTDLLKIMYGTTPTTMAARMEQEMGMRFSLSPWPRKRGEPALDVVVSTPSSVKSSVKEGGDGSIYGVGTTYVGRRGSEWNRGGGN